MSTEKQVSFALLNLGLTIQLRIVVWPLMASVALFGLISRRGRGGSSEISPPLLRSSGLSKNLFYPPLLTSIFLSTGYFAFSLLEILTLSFQSLHFSYVPYIGVKLLIWTTYSLLCRVMLYIMCLFRVS